MQIVFNDAWEASFLEGFMLHQLWDQSDTGSRRKNSSES